MRSLLHVADVLRRACCVCGFASAVAMLVGVLGPWATFFRHTVFQHSVSGVDSNNGWFVVTFAALGAFALADYVRVPRLWKAAWAAAAGAAGVAVALDDRHQIQHGLSRTHINILQALQPFVRVGWGLNLTIVASLVMGLAALVLIVIDRVASLRRTREPVSV